MLTNGGLSDSKKLNQSVFETDEVVGNIKSEE